MQSFAVKVKKNSAELVRQALRRLNLLNTGFVTVKDAISVLLPIVGKPSDQQWQLIKAIDPDASLLVADFQQIARRPKDIIEALKDKLSPSELASLPHSIDIIGDIAVVEVPEELKHHEPLIGNAILEVYKNVQAVYVKAGRVEGIFRTRPLRCIAGIPKEETVHKEYGCSFVLNVNKVYFSPRLLSERQRVVSQVKAGEVIVDMFAGVGPYAIRIAKATNAKVYAIDVNPEAIRYLKRNIELNRVQDRVIPILGDSRQIILSELINVADRVIMNLPTQAYDYLDAACSALKKEGGIIHYYEFTREAFNLEASKERLSKRIQELGRKVLGVIYAGRVKQVAPRTWQIVIDVKVA
ncbi:MAG: class I SAM-dependent methyltransferase family protein [Candidatus Nezhaarchaeales archaeon]